MAKELMEIGGFITEGAEIVNHDSTLSGNGTVDSPLGLNETVLWEGSKSTSGDINLSEAFTNFDRLRIYFKDNERKIPHVNEVGTDVSNATASWITLSTIVCGNGTFATIISVTLTYNSAKTVLTIPASGTCIVYAWSSGSWNKLTGAAFEPPVEITKIVGIGRKA